MTTRPRLGRGLDSLIARPVAPTAETRAPFVELPIGSIRPMPGQPRRHFDDAALDELAESIRASGVIQPLVVRRHEVGYVLIAGERRWRAANRAGLATVPAVVREATDAEAFGLALIENVQRADLNPIEEAEAYRRLVEEFGLTQEQIALRVGRQRSTIANALRLLRLPAALVPAVLDGRLTAGHARAVLAVDDPALQEDLGQRILDEALSVRQAEALARDLREHGNQPPPDNDDPGEPQPRADREPAPLRPQLQAVRRRLMEAWGTRVEIRTHAGRTGGTIELHWADEAALADLVERLLADRDPR